MLFPGSSFLSSNGQMTPTQFLESINAINELLISAYSLRHTFLDNTLAVFTLQLSKLVKTPHFEKVCFLHTLGAFVLVP